ncbi:GNAT family N-acetyltransferase [Nocardioides pacificus]
MSAVIRDARREDRPTALAVVRSAFGDEGAEVGGLVEALWASGRVRAELVAEVDGLVVGHVMLSDSWVDARERLVPVLVLAPLAISPERQREGCGARLVEAAAQRAEELGAPAVFLEGDPGYYGRLGFERGSAHGFVRPSVRIPDAAFQVRRLSGHQPRLTGALVYCEPFWAQDCVGLRDPLLAELERRFA